LRSAWNGREIFDSDPRNRNAGYDLRDGPQGRKAKRPNERERGIASDDEHSIRPLGGDLLDHEPRIFGGDAGRIRAGLASRAKHLPSRS